MNKKILVIGILILFIGMSIPSTGSNIAVEKSSKTITKAPMDAPLPPLMWTEDFSTLYIKIPGDPGGGYVCYYIDWGDGNTESTGWYESNETVALSHIWGEGEYTIKVKAEDQYGEESKWATYGLILSSDFKLFHISIGYVGITYIFTIYWKDCVYYLIDWGDGSSSDWIGPYPEEIVIITHTWSSPGEYMLKIKGKDIYGNQSDWLTLIITILSLENNPPDAPIINGPTHGEVGVEYTYTFNSTDYDGDSFIYYVDWGDGSPIEIVYPTWPNPEEPGEGIANHSWDTKGAYVIRARAEDVNGLIGPWGKLQVTMPRNKPFNSNFNLLSWFFERFPNAFPLLRYILGLQ